MAVGGMVVERTEESATEGTTAEAMAAVIVAAVRVVVRVVVARAVAARSGAPVDSHRPAAQRGAATQALHESCTLSRSLLEKRKKKNVPR